MTDKTEHKQIKGRFKKGQSGNPKGRPKGSLNSTTLAAQSLLDGEAEELTRKAVQLAMKGNIPALKLCLERIISPKRETTIDEHKTEAVPVKIIYVDEREGEKNE